MRRHLFLLAALAAVPAAAQADRGDELLALRAQDARVATIGHRLATANRDLCGASGWQAGIVLHDLATYGGDYYEPARRVFGLGDGPSVLALAAGGPAERAGLRADDRILALDGQALATPPRGRLSAAVAERLWQALDAAFADGAAELRVARAGAETAIRVEAERGCPTRFQQVPGAGLRAEANGIYVEITSALVAYAADEDELAAVLAHEFAHNLLEHRRRLDEANVRRGLLRYFGRNARLFRETEAEADRISVHLMEAAGYDIDAAARFWRRFGPRGLNLGDTTHPPWRRRLAALEDEAAQIRAARNRP
jgi:Zn-dependent protease with chaperone function